MELKLSSGFAVAAGVCDRGAVSENARMVPFEAQMMSAALRKVLQRLHYPLEVALVRISDEAESGRPNLRAAQAESTAFQIADAVWPFPRR
jgi:hypothetical protein